MPRLHAHRPSAAATIVIGFLVGACGSSGSAPSVLPSAPVESSVLPAETASPSATSGPTASSRPIAIPRPDAVPTDGSCEEGLTCLGVLTVGSHHTEHFSPGFGFDMLSDRWVNFAEDGGSFGFLSIDRPGDAIFFFRQPWPTKPDGVRAPGVASVVADLTAWLTANPALVASEPQQVTIGGLAGTQMDLALASGAENGDPSCPAQVCVNVFIGRSRTWEWDWGFAGPERQRLYLLEAPDTVLAIFVDSLDGTTFDAMIADADAILATVRFDAP